jgi:hypothetical protein
MSESEIITWLQEVLVGNTPALPDNSKQCITDTLELSDWHGVTPLVHYKLSEKDNLNLYPSDLNEQLSARTRQTIAVSLLWKQEIINVHKALEDAKLKFLLIKGFPLAWSLYPAPHLREYSDIDVLFPDYETTMKAWQILEDMDYARPNAISGKYISYQFSCYRAGISDHSCVLDLHWRVNNHYYFASALKFEELEKSSRRIPGFAPNMRTLAPEYALLLACLHRIAHTQDNKSDRLIWLYDIHLLAESFNIEQWNCFSVLATGKKLSSICHDGLMNCKNRFNTRIPEDVIENFVHHGKNDPIQSQSLATNRKYLLTSIQTMPGWTARICFLREHLLPPADYMLKKYNTDKKWLLPVLYVKRIANGIQKLFKT